MDVAYFENEFAARAKSQLSLYFYEVGGALLRQVLKQEEDAII